MTLRLFMRLMIAALYLGAGALHIMRPEGFLAITPDWVPFPRAVIVATGWCEIAGAIGLFIPATRVPAAWALALYALCVWPANFKHAFAGVVVPGIPDTWWYHAPRLLAQPFLIWATLYCAGVPVLERFRRKG